MFWSHFLFVRVDLHNHTWYSKDGMMSPGKLFWLAKKRGLDAVAVTDHNRLTVVTNDEITVIPGEEIRTTRGEIIALFINEEIPPHLEPEETIDLIKEQGGLVVIPHPFDKFRKRTALLLNYRKELPKNILIEVKNGRYVKKEFEERALAYARERGLPMVGGSDAHTPVEVGRCYTVVPPFSDSEELFNYLRRGKTRVEGSPSPPWVHLTVPPIKLLHAAGVIPRDKT